MGADAGYCATLVAQLRDARLQAAYVSLLTGSIYRLMKHGEAARNTFLGAGCLPVLATLLRADDGDVCRSVCHTLRWLQRRDLNGPLYAALRGAGVYKYCMRPQCRLLPSRVGLIFRGRSRQLFC